MSSVEIQIRLQEMETDLKQVYGILMHNGQYVAAHCLTEGVGGIQKTLSCWNDLIEWPFTTSPNKGKP